MAVIQRIRVVSWAHCVKVHVRYLISWWVLVWLSIHGVHIGATYTVQLNRPSVTAMRPYVKSFWPLVFISFSFTTVRFCIYVLCILNLKLLKFNSNRGSVFSGILYTVSSGMTSCYTGLAYKLAMFVFLSTALLFSFLLHFLVFCYEQRCYYRPHRSLYYVRRCCLVLPTE